MLLKAMLLCAVTLLAPAADPEAKDAAAGSKESEAPALTVTEHSITVGGRPLEYRATAGVIRMKSEQGEHRADIFHVAYTLKGDQDPRERPVTFVFNGGPGSSSVWLHLGTAGPKRVLMADDAGMPPAPPYEMADNEFTWLVDTDLVFIDPVGTGYSRPAKDVKQTEFSGLEEDIESVGEFIRLWTTKNERWASPKFLAGESYGTTRAAGLAGHLQDRHGMYLNGVILVSSILSFQTARFDAGNDLPYVLFLPTYTATAHYHRRLPDDLQQRPLEDVLNEVETWALGEYMHALALGDDLPADRAAAIAQRLARYTGLSEEYVRSTNLRVNIMRFTKELMRDDRRTVGRLDSRYTGFDADAAGERFEHDPSMSAIMGVYTATLNDYVRRELEYENDLPYEILTGRVQPWSYSAHENRYVNVAETLRQAMSENQHLKALVAAGYFDLATPYFAAEYTVSHMRLDPAVKGNVRITHYPAGHMMYVERSSLERLRDDVRAFVEWATAE